MADVPKMNVNTASDLEYWRPKIISKRVHREPRVKLFFGGRVRGLKKNKTKVKRARTSKWRNLCPQKK